MFGLPPPYNLTQSHIFINYAVRKSETLHMLWHGPLITTPRAHHRSKHEKLLHPGLMSQNRSYERRVFRSKYETTRRLERRLELAKEQICTQLGLSLCVLPPWQLEVSKPTTCSRDCVLFVAPARHGSRRVYCPKRRGKLEHLGFSPSLSDLIPTPDRA